jgi:hypothetical protein
MKAHLPNKGAQELPGPKGGISHIVCGPCGCASGYGPPPTVEDCPCVCHDTARLWYQMKPYRLETGP